jgi:hypothetical protein
MAEQMKAFAEGAMWMTPLEYIDADGWPVAPYRFGGRTRDVPLAVRCGYRTAREGGKIHGEGEGEAFVIFA